LAKWIELVARDGSRELKLVVSARRSPDSCLLDRTMRAEVREHPARQGVSQQARRSPGSCLLDRTMRAEVREHPARQGVSQHASRSRSSPL